MIAAQTAYMSVLEGKRFREGVEIKKFRYDADAIRKLVRNLVADEIDSKGFDREQTESKMQQMLDNPAAT